MPYHLELLTVIETPIYSHKVGGILAADEREAVAAFISANPMSGRVVRGSGGVRKVRWTQPGKGKSSGARIIYYNRLTNGEVWLLTIFAKADRSTIPAHELRLIKETIDDDQKTQDVRGRRRASQSGQANEGREERPRLHA